MPLRRKKKTTQGTSSKQNRSGGSAGSGGFSFQAYVLSFVGVHMLAERNLGWCKLDKPDIPLAVESETGGVGDDLRVHLRDTPWILEVQAKRGLESGSKLNTAMGPLASGIRDNPQLIGVLAVDQLRTSKGITTNLAQDLERLRAGRNDDLKPITQAVLETLRADGTESSIPRLYITTLDLEQDFSAHRLLALEILRHFLSDPDRSEDAWAHLLEEADRIMTNRSRWDLKFVSDLLGRRRITVLAENARQALRDTPNLLWQDRLDVAKKLLDHNYPSAALKFLQEFEPSSTYHTAPATMARLHILKGAALANLSMHDDARKEFELALSFDPTNTKSLSNLSFIHLAQNDLRMAALYARRAIESDRENIAAWKALLLSNPKNPPQLPEYLENIPDIITTRGDIEFHQGRWAEAHRLYSVAITHGDRKPELLVRLVEASVRKSQSEQSPLGNDAEHLASEALKSLESTELTGLLAHALRLRGEVLLINGREEEGLADVKRAADLAPSSIETIVQAAHAHALHGAPAIGLELLGRIPTNQIPPSAWIDKARCLLDLNRAKEIEPALKQALEGAASIPQRGDIYAAAVEIAIHAEEFDLAAQLLQNLQASLAPSQLSHLRGRLSFAKRDFARGESEYLAAIQASQGNIRRNIQLELAQYLQSIDNEAQAKTLYQEAGAATAQDPIRRFYAQSLLKTGDLKGGAELLALIESSSKVPEWAIEFGAQIALRREDIPMAVRYLEQLVIQPSAPPSYRLALAQSYIRQGNTDKAIPLLESLANDNSLTAEMLAQVSAWLKKANMPNTALDAAYQAIRRDPANATVRLHYIDTFVKSESNIPLEVDAVGPDVHVVLQSTTGKKVEYSILANGKPEKRLKEFLASDPDIAWLIGRKKGDVVVLRKGLPSEVTLEITEISHIYTQLFRETTGQFSEMFPENMLFHAFSISEKPTLSELTSKLAPLLGDMTERRKTLAEIRKELPPPIDFVCTLLGTDFRRTYAHLASSLEEPFWVEFGDRTRAASSISAALTAKDVVLTRSALLTLQELNLFPIVEKALFRCAIPQSVVDQILIEETDAPILRQQQKYWHATSVPIANEFTDSYVSNARLLKWIREHCQILPKPLVNTASEMSQVLEHFSTGSVDTMLHSLSNTNTLWADDLGLRLAADALGASAGFSTYAFIIAMQKKGLVSAEKSRRWLSSLVSLNHFYISITADLVLDLLAESSWSVTPELETILDRLKGKFSDTTSTTTVVARILRGSLSTVGGTYAFPVVARHCLRRLVDGRKAPVVLRLLETILRKELHLHPRMLDEALAKIQSFQQELTRDHTKIL